MSQDGAALGAAVPISHARAAASRRNGAKSRGPKTPAGKARSAQNALKHGMRALRYVVLPDEDGVAFQALEAALMDELAPVGTLQVVLVRRVAMAAWRLARADRMEVELFEERRWEDGGVGMALIRDGNGTRVVRNPDALPRRCYGRVLARAQDAQGAPGRGSRRCRRRGRSAGAARSAAGACGCAAAPTRSAPEDRPSVRTERTRAPARCRTCAPSRIRPARPTGSGRTLHEPAAPPGRRTNPKPNTLPALTNGRSWRNRLSLDRLPARVENPRSSRRCAKGARAPWIERTRGSDERVTPPCSGARRRLRSASPCSRA